MDYLANLINTFNPEVEAQVHPDALAALAEDAHADDGELVAIPAFYQPLFEACHAVAGGLISAEQWIAVWQAVAARLLEIASGVESSLAKVREAPHFVQAAGEQLLGGIQAALDALDSMGQYLDRPDPEFLNQGWLALVRATGTIQHATAEFARFEREVS